MNLLIFNLKTDAADAILGFTNDWINALAIHFEKIVVLSMSAGQLNLAANVQVHSVGKEKRYGEVRRAFNFYALLWKILKTEKIDACFVHMIPVFAVMGWPLLKLKRIPMMLWYAHRARSGLLRLATNLVDRVVSASAGSFPIATPKLKILGHGIDTNRFIPGTFKKSETVYQILTIGRIAPVKNLHILIQAIAELKKMVHTSFKLKIMGPCLLPEDRLYLQELKDLCEKLHVQNDVQFADAVPHYRIQTEYQQTDCFINLSDTGSVDKAVLEAMSCGVAVITSNLAFVEIFSEMPSWALSQAHPDIIALAIQSQMAILDQQKIKKQVREIVIKNHSLPKLAQQITDEFNALIALVRN